MYMIIFMSLKIIKALDCSDLYIKIVNEIEVSPREYIREIFHLWSIAKVTPLRIDASTFV